MIARLQIFSLFTLYALVASSSPAATPAETIMPLLSDNTVAAARVDLKGIDLPAMEQATIEGLGKNQAIDANEREARVVDVKITFANAQKWVKAMTDAGGREVYVLLDISHVRRAGPILAVPVAAGADKAAITNLLTTGDAATTDAGRNPQTVGGQVGDLMVVASKAWIDQRLAAKAVNRPSVTKAFEAAGDAALSLVVVPSESARREMENVIAVLPAELGGGPITDVSRGVEWAAISINKAPVSTGQLLIQTPNPEAAQKLEDIINTGIDLMLQQQELARGEFPHAREVLNATRPEVKGPQLIATVGAETGVSELVGQLGLGMIRARGAANAVKSMSNMRQMVVAAMMYAQEHNGQLPDKIEDLESHLGQGNEAIFRAVTTNPAAPDRRPAYAYFRPFEGSINNVKDPQDRLILHETFDQWPGKVNVAFADGHVEMIANQQRFDQLLKNAQPPAANP